MHPILSIIESRGQVLTKSRTSDETPISGQMMSPRPASTRTTRWKTRSRPRSVLPIQGAAPPGPGIDLGQTPAPFVPTEDGDDDEVDLIIVPPWMMLLD